MRFLRLSGFKIGLLLTAMVLFVYVVDQVQDHHLASFFRQVELKAYDYRFKLRGQRNPGEDVVILAIDEKSIEELGRFPWARRVFGKAVENLRKDGVAVVANDIVFSEPDPADGDLEKIWALAKKYQTTGLRSPEVLPADYDDAFSDILAGLGEREDAQLRQKIARLRDQVRENASSYEKQSRSFYNNIKQLAIGANDEAYAREIEKLPGFVAGYFFYDSLQEVEGLKEEDYTTGKEVIDPARVTVRELPSEVEEFEPFALLQEAVGVRTNIAPISAAAAHHGFFNAQQDVDGVLRTYRSIERFGDSLYPSLAVEAVRAFYGHLDPGAPNDIVADYRPGVGVESLNVAGTDVPVDERGSLLINYYGQKKQFAHYSFADVVNGNFEPGTFKDKIVLIGSTAIAVFDLRPTPFQRNFPGVEIHASVVQNILSNNFMQPRGYTLLASEFGLILLIGMFLGIFVPRVRAVLGAAVSIVLLIGFTAANFAMFDQGIWLNFIYPALTIIIVYGGITIFRYATEEKEKKQIKSAFGLYLHPAMVDQLAEHPDSLKLGGERRNLTAFFSDIQGFSTFSEGMEPENLVNFLNEYLTEMTEILQSYDATVDKYIGDAIVAFFGAPLPFEDHAIKACHATLDMQRRLDELRHGWKEQGLPMVYQRIGMNTGDVVVGNMGSSKRFNYTMMGDTVNLAARLESGAKQYGVYQMIAEETEKAARDAIETRWLDYLVVKGKSIPVTIYELIAKKGELDHDQMWQDVLGLWRDGIAAYRGKNFMQALAKFEEIHNKVRPGDSPSKVYIERCQAFIQNPPPEDWDGVWIATSK